jgi:DNA-binding transcriptional LysR family regulator
MNNIKLLPSLLVFAEVAQRDSFTAAAQHLGMSKSAVSQHISRLEEQIGFQLLSRNTRGMALTANGAKLLSRSELLKDQVELAFQELSSVEQTPSGLFSVTFPHLLEKDVVIPALGQLCKEFTRIEIRVLITDEPLDLINDKLDVAIYGGELRDSNYRALPVGKVSEIFCASPAYIQKFGSPETLEEVTEHRWISASWQNASQSVHCNRRGPGEGKKQLEQTTPLHRFAESNSLSCVMSMAQQDMGYVLLPEIASQSLIDQGLMVQIMKRFHGEVWPFYFVHPFQGEKPVHVTRFYQLIKHYFARAKLSSRV